MASSPLIQCPHCQSKQHTATECMSQHNLICFDDDGDSQGTETVSTRVCEPPSTVTFVFVADCSQIPAQEDASDQFRPIALESRENIIIHTSFAEEDLVLCDESPNAFPKDAIPAIDSPSPAITSNDVRSGKEAKKAIQRSSIDQELINTKSAATAAATAAATLGWDRFVTKSSADVIINSPKDRYVLSEDEDLDKLRKIGVQRVISWKDGDSKRALDKRAGRNLRGRENIALRDNKGSSALRMDEPGVKPEEAHLPTAKADPLQSMIPLKTKNTQEILPNSSFLALAQGQGKNVGKEKKQAVEPVIRTLNLKTNTMNVSHIKRKRQGTGKQHSYYNITPELHYLR